MLDRLNRLLRRYNLMVVKRPPGTRGLRRAAVRARQSNATSDQALATWALGTAQAMDRTND